METKQITVDNKACKLQLWDTAGQEEHKSMTNTFYRRANGFLLVYDITNLDSFNAISTWMDEIGKFLEKGDYSRILVGAKSDL